MVQMDIIKNDNVLNAEGKTLPSSRSVRHQKKEPARMPDPQGLFQCTEPSPPFKQDIVDSTTHHYVSIQQCVKKIVFVSSDFWSVCLDILDHIPSG